jgi:uncharacterized protein (TIGR02145 family)
MRVEKSLNSKYCIMKTKNRIWILILSIMFIFLSRCKTQEIFLHGDITGKVTDASSGEPVEAASVKIDPSNDSTTTGSDGTYLLRNVNPGPYESQASKSSYALYKRNVTVVSAEPQEIDFPLTGIPEPKPSTSFLDFSLDSTKLSFSISNSGKGKFSYFLTSSQQTWIHISPTYGDITNETDNITVTINKTGLSKSIYKESIIITSREGQVPLADKIISVYLNGVMDSDRNYYKVVTIGTQIYMAENLKTTRYIDGTAVPFVTDKTVWNTINTPGYCWYNDASTYKDTYGALYNWYAVNTGKLCPTGWHVPTYDEWKILENYIGGSTSGYKLRETGTIHWLAPNDGTNESGFTGLPGGWRNTDPINGSLFSGLGNDGAWWSSTEYSTTFVNDWYIGNSIGISFGYDNKQNGLSVRCLKD